jgi:histone-lysine N-methyltransferase SETD3
LERDAADEKKDTVPFPSYTMPESEMRGVHATENLPPDTVCLTIPRKCLITVEMGQATPIGQAILAADLDLDAPKHIFLMIYILWDRKVNGEQSFFNPYYNILPKSLRNMPIFWSQDELDYLQGSDMLEQIADRIDAITEDYFAICSVVPDFNAIATLEEFKWARMCVCSRNFGLLIDGHRTSAMVPFADMLNHYRPRETKWTFDDDRDAFTITTSVNRLFFFYSHKILFLILYPSIDNISIQGIPSGAQVNDSYGSKSNHRFLLNYG